LSRIEMKAFSGTGFIEIVIPASVGFLGVECFSWCQSLWSVTFESGSRLSQIKHDTFAITGLVEIVIPASVKILDEGCFLQCESLSSVTFESGCHDTASQDSNCQADTEGESLGYAQAAFESINF
jgi:hypothetical protein